MELLSLTFIRPDSVNGIDLRDRENRCTECKNVEEDPGLDTGFPELKKIDFSIREQNSGVSTFNVQFRALDTEPFIFSTEVSI